MKRQRARRAVVLGLLGLLGIGGGGAPAAAQAAAGDPPVPLEVQSVDTSLPPRVVVTLTAPRAAGGTVVGPEHVTVMEDGIRRPVDVLHLPNDALEVVLVIDTSGSMQGEAMAAAKAAAVQFVNTMPPGARIAVVGFGDDPVLATPFGASRDDVVAAIEGLEADGETALYDALVTAGAQLAGSSLTEARRYVVVLSDGADTVSERTLEQASSVLTELDTGFFAVALATSESDLGALATLAQARDGKVAAASEPSEIAGVYDTIASQLVNQYRVTYESQTEGATRVAISLTADGATAVWQEIVDLPPFPENATPDVAAAHPYVAADPAWYQQDWVLLAGVAPFGLALLLAIGLVLTGREPKRRLARELGKRGPAEASVWAGVAGRATAVADRVLSDNARGSRLNVVLEQAGIAMRPGELVVLVGAATVAGATGGLLVLGPVGALLAVVGVPVAAWGTVSTVRTRRQRKLAEQLGDTLQLLAGSLRAGHGLVQALDMVTREAESPTAEEFHRVIVEARLGRDLAESLDALAARSGNEDIEWVVQAIRIHREVGGDLAEILDRVGETIRDRNRVRGQIRSLTAEGRLSAIILMALPFLVGAWMYMSNRPYVEELTARPQGRVLLFVGAVLMSIGAAVMRRLVKPEF